MKNNNNKGLITVLIIIIIALIALVALMATGKVTILKTESDKCKTTPNTEVENKTEEETSTEEPSIDEEFKLDTIDSSKITSNNEYTVGISVKTYHDNDVFVRLIATGKVNVTTTSNDVNTYLTNVNNVVDVISVPIEGEDYNMYYMLLSNGDVYKYSGSDIKNNKYTAEKVDKVKEVKRLLLVEEIIKANQPNIFSAVAVTKDNQYITL